MPVCWTTNAFLESVVCWRPKRYFWSFSDVATSNSFHDPQCALRFNRAVYLSTNRIIKTTCMPLCWNRVCGESYEMHLWRSNGFCRRCTTKFKLSPRLCLHLKGTVLFWSGLGESRLTTVSVLPTVADGKLKPLCLAALSLKLSDCLLENNPFIRAEHVGYWSTGLPHSISFCLYHCLPFNIVWCPQHSKRNCQRGGQKLPKTPNVLLM